jgi:hypothetical protein
MSAAHSEQYSVAFLNNVSLLLRAFWLTESARFVSDFV